MDEQIRYKISQQSGSDPKENPKGQNESHSSDVFHKLLQRRLASWLEKKFEKIRS